MKLILLIPLAAYLALAQAGQSDDPPEGKGKAVLLRACVECHEVSVATRNRYTEAGWRQMVETMKDRGAELTDPETADVIAYLTKNFGKTNINKATATQLEEQLGLTEAEGQAIISYRQQNGDIKTLDQLKTVPGLSPDKLQAKAAEIAFSD